MGTEYYGHAEAIMLQGQDKRRATLAKKKREKTMREATAEDIARREGVYDAQVCPGCHHVWFGEKPWKCLHRHPEDNELFEIETVAVKLAVSI